MKKICCMKGLVFALVFLVVCTTFASATRNIIDSTSIETNHQEYEVETEVVSEIARPDTIIFGLVTNLESDGNIHTFNAVFVVVINVTEFIDWVIDGCDPDDMGWITPYYNLEKFTVDGHLIVLEEGPFGYVKLIFFVGTILSIEPQW